MALRACGGLALGLTAGAVHFAARPTAAPTVHANMPIASPQHEKGEIARIKALDAAKHGKAPSKMEQLPWYKRQTFSTQFRDYTLGEIIPITHDVALFRFLLEDQDDVFNLRPCSTLQARVSNGVNRVDEVQRFYTPVTQNGTPGYFDIIVKRKRNGAMTSHLFGMQVGDSLKWRACAFKVRYTANRWDHVGMITGGTGFTPMLQVIRHGLSEDLRDMRGNPDKTKLSLIYANRSERHVLLKGLFDDLAAKHSDRFKVLYTVDSLAGGGAPWQHDVGLINEDHIKMTRPAPDEPNKIILVCGPDQLLAHTCGTSTGTAAELSGSKHHQPVAPDLNNSGYLGGVLGRMGYNDEDVYRF